MSIEAYSGTPPKDGLLYFTAAWCGPCRMVKPELAKLKDVHVVAVDIDDHPDVAEHWRVTAVPTFLRFVDGELAERAVGVMRASDLRAMLLAPVVIPSRVPALDEPVLGSKRKATVVVRYRLAEALLAGVQVVDADPDDVLAPSLVEVEGATVRAIRLFVKQLVDEGHAKTVAKAAEPDDDVSIRAAHTSVSLTRSGRAHLRKETARLRRLVGA